MEAPTSRPLRYSQSRYRRPQRLFRPEARSNSPRLALIATAVRKNITTQVTWSSSNTNVATINSSGLASAIAGGSASIVASFGGGETAISGSAALTVQATPLVIGTTTLPSGLEGQAYLATLVASGGTAPYTWSMANNTSLPPGLSLSSGGKISGAPTVAGTGTFTVQVTDGASPPQTATQSLSIMITSPPAFYTIWTPPRFQLQQMQVPIHQWSWESCLSPT